MSEATFETVQSCTKVVLDLYAAIDAGNARSAVRLFAEDAVFETTKQRAEGLAAVSSFLGAREDDRDKRTIHALTNLRHTVTSRTQIEVEALMLVYGPGRGDEAPPWVLEHAVPARHVLRRVDDTWLIAERVPA